MAVPETHVGGVEIFVIVIDMLMVHYDDRMPNVTLFCNANAPPSAYMKRITGCAL